MWFAMWDKKASGESESGWGEYGIGILSEDNRTYSVVMMAGNSTDERTDW